MVAFNTPVVTKKTPWVWWRRRSARPVFHQLNNLADRFFVGIAIAVPISAVPVTRHGWLSVRVINLNRFWKSI